MNQYAGEPAATNMQDGANTVGIKPAAIAVQAERNVQAIAAAATVRTLHNAQMLAAIAQAQRSIQALAAALPTTISIARVQRSVQALATGWPTTTISIAQVQRSAQVFTEILIPALLAEMSAVDRAALPESDSSFAITNEFRLTVVVFVWWYALALYLYGVVTQQQLADWVTTLLGGGGFPFATASARIANSALKKISASP